MKTKCVIFDFDGVIANTKQIAFLILQELETSIKIEDLEEFAKGNVYESQKYVMTKEKQYVFDKKQATLLTTDLLFPISSLIEKLSKSYVLYIVSSSQEQTIQTFLEQTNLNNYFQKIYGKTTHLSKIVKFQMIFDEHGLTADECIFITDTSGDLKEAKQVCIPSIGVTWGYHSREILQQEKNLIICDTVDELSEFFEQKNRKKEEV